MVLAVSYKRTEYAWRLYRIVSYEKIPQKDFRQQIVRCSSPSILPTSRTGHGYKIADEIWLDVDGITVPFVP